MKNLFTLLALSCLMLLTACSGEDGLPGDAPTTASTARQQVLFRMPRATVSEFQAAGISDVTIYAYISERKKDSLVQVTTLPIGDGQLTVNLPLGESLATFAVANVASVSDEDSLATVTLHLDPTQEKEVWVSDIVSFSSDKTVPNVDLTMQRIVGQLAFQPEETADELAAATSFDALDITFTNIATAWRVKDAAPVMEDITVGTTLAAGYVKNVYSFPTAGEGGAVSMLLSYKKGNTVVNQSLGTIDTGIRIETSTRYNIVMPITDESYTQTPVSAKANRAAARTRVPFYIYTTQL